MKIDENTNRNRRLLTYIVIILMWCSYAAWMAVVKIVGSDLLSYDTSREPFKSFSNLVALQKKYY